MLLKSIVLKNFLSFGDESTLELRPLNVLIGANGAGKSNLFKAIDLLRADSDFVRKVVELDWIWNGANSPRSGTVSARLSATLALPRHDGEARYNLSFLCNTESPYSPAVYEAIEHDDHRDIGEGRGQWMRWLAAQFAGVFIYREGAVIPPAWLIISNQSASRMPDDVLMRNGQNLLPVIARMSASPTIKSVVLDALSALQDNITDFGIQSENDHLRIYVQESERTVYPERFSSGMRQWLSLLAILCAPVPPPLICIEHPEQGLHPDALPKLAELLKAASERSQVIVTTHSETLLDALTGVPEAVVVVEKGEQGSTLTRLDAEKMKPWLEKYSLGDFWMRGGLGGVRW